MQHQGQVFILLRNEMLRKFSSITYNVQIHTSTQNYHILINDDSHIHIPCKLEQNE